MLLDLRDLQVLEVQVETLADREIEVTQELMDCPAKLDLLVM